jgi:hypothetical protein
MLDQHSEFNGEFELSFINFENEMRDLLGLDQNIEEILR